MSFHPITGTYRNYGWLARGLLPVAAYPITRLSMYECTIYIILLHCCQVGETVCYIGNWYYYRKSEYSPEYPYPKPLPLPLS